MSGSSERGAIEFWLGVASGLIASVIAGLILALLFSNEQITRRTADRFLREYYGQAVRATDRDRSWNMLTVDLRNSDKIQEGNLRGRKAYNVFFDKWREVRLGQVDRVAGDVNRFEVNLTYISKTGRVSRTENVNFQLVCSWWINKLPLLNCNPKDIKIDDTVYGH